MKSNPHNNIDPAHKKSSRPFVIAVDGPTAAGKGTVSQALAKRLDCAYLETGALYRAVAAKLLELPQAVRQSQNLHDRTTASHLAASLEQADLKRSDLRREEVGSMASRLAEIPEIRAALLEYQRDFATHPPAHKSCVILDGRDIGTVVCPNADVKLFVTASIEARAQRRFKELQERGERCMYTRVLEDLRERDERDARRVVAPLTKADDAYELDTTDLGPAAVLEKALGIIAKNR